MLWANKIGRMGLVIVVIVVIATIPSADADPIGSSSTREKCRETSFRMEHPDLCRQYYGPGPFSPSNPNPDDGGLLGLIRRVLGGLL